VNDIFEIENLVSTPFVKEQYEWQDIMVTAATYDSSKEYICQRGHTNLQMTALYPTSTRFDPKTSRFEVKGEVVMVCGICKSPVRLIKYE
jgi:formate-dependent nitrite reductase cytochrome c552 subunit